MTTVSQIFQSMDWGPAPESDKAALAWLARYNHTFGHYLGGRFTEPVEGALFDVINPSNRQRLARVDRKSTRLNSSHANISYAVFCLKKKKTITKSVISYRP